MLELELLAEKASSAVALGQPRPLVDVPTPALLVDEALLGENVERMTSFLASKGKQARPHAKTHKCPEISKRQLNAGAVGICCAKASEAFVQAHAGIGDILITSPVTHSDRESVLAQTNSICDDLKLVVDSEVGLAVAESAASKSDSILGIVLDIDVEMGRTGNRSADSLRALADRIERSDVLSLRGVQHYAGHLQHVESFAQRQERSLASWDKALEIAHQLQAAGHELGIITGGGTGTFDIDSAIEEITDLQVGSYIFMDQEYLAIEGSDANGRLPFANSLTIQATAISQPTKGIVTLDCGYKAMASETVAPHLLDLPHARVKFAGDEHSIAILQKGSQEPLLGEKFQLISPHCDPTVNLYDYMWVHANGCAHSLWPITGRGCAW